MNHSLQAVKQRFGIIGTSKLLDAALDTALRVAATDLTVLITGESGVGKEVFSKIIHSFSARKHQPFIAVNCGAIPEGTINSELFGHEKGSFTSSVGDRKGYFETVNGGTIFLDEIGEMPLNTQPLLLRLLENGEFTRVGSSKTEKTDVRVVTATNVNLVENVAAGRFREDLYYRLNIVPIRIPPLRERRDDIYLLFRKFSIDFSEKYRMQPVTLDDRAQILLENYPFPGNIRELKNMAEQLSVLSQERLITAEKFMDWMPHILKRNLPAMSKAANESLPLNERDILYKLLFGMKDDLNDLKSLVYELIKTNNLSVPNMGMVQSNRLPAPVNVTRSETDFEDLPRNSDKMSDLIYERANQQNIANQRFTENANNAKAAQPIILTKPQDSFDVHEEVVDESLSLLENEKRQIVKALKKHHNRRKEAAKDLGISERTLYRKITEYGLEP
jgi:DNA-binding NtrC family response regulator